MYIYNFICFCYVQNFRKLKKEMYEKMKKKLLISLMSLFVILTLMGCGAKEEANVNTPSNDGTTVNKEEPAGPTVEELDAMIKEEGEKDNPDKNRLLELMTEAADKGSTYALYCFVMEYQYGSDFDKDEAKAKEYFEKLLSAYDENNTDGKDDRYLAGCYSYGAGTDVDATKGLEYAQKGLDKGNVDCHSVLANLYYGTIEGTERDEQKLYEHLLAYCESAKEDIDYSFYFGVAECYLLGIGVEKDVNKGIEWAEKAADGGIVNAIELLSRLYYCGSDDAYAGVEITRDYDKAFNYLDKAGAKGDSDTYLILALTYYNGKNAYTQESACDIDFEKSLSYFEKVFESEKEPTINVSYHMLAGTAAYRIGDYKKAREYWQQSIDLGEASADTARSNIEALDKKGL